MLNHEPGHALVPVVDLFEQRRTETGRIMTELETLQATLDAVASGSRLLSPEEFRAIRIALAFFEGQLSSVMPAQRAALQRRISLQRAFLATVEQIYSARKTSAH